MTTSPHQFLSQVCGHFFLCSCNLSKYMKKVTCSYSVKFAWDVGLSCSLESCFAMKMGIRRNFPWNNYIDCKIILEVFFLLPVCCFEMIRILTARYGTLCIRENPGCIFISTNRDSVGHMTDLQEWSGKKVIAHMYNIQLTILLHYSSVLKPGPDRQVQPWTGHNSGPIYL